MMGIAGEIVLPREAKPQPHPEIHKGGDCGACALGGALGMEVAEVYRRFDSEGLTHAGEMARCIRCASSYELADRIIQDSAEWPDALPWCKSFGRPAVLEYLAWFNYVRMAIDAGYYGLAQVNYDGSKIIGEYETNHWVLIRGARTDGAVTGKVMTGEVLVSCSAGRLNGWHEAREFLKHRGGYDLLFVRPNLTR
jgi:hypothetical protein